MTTLTQDSPRDTVEITEYAPTQMLGTITDNFDDSDFKVDRLNLVQKIGPLSDTFSPGCFVLNKEVALTNPGEKNEYGEDIVFTLLSLTKWFQEDLPFDSAEMPLRAHKPEEVIAKGGVLKYDTVKPKNYWKKMLGLQMLIKAPNEDFNHLFCLTGPDGIKYEKANHILGGRSLRKAGVDINTRARKLGEQKLPFYTHPWKMSARKETSGEYTTYVSAASPLPSHSDEMIAWIKEI